MASGIFRISPQNTKRVGIRNILLDPAIVKFIDNGDFSISNVRFVTEKKIMIDSGIYMASDENDVPHEIKVKYPVNLSISKFVFGDNECSIEVDTTELKEVTTCADGSISTLEGGLLIGPVDPSAEIPHFEVMAIFYVELAGGE